MRNYPAIASLLKKGQTTKEMLNQLALNILEYSKCEEKDVCQYMCDLFNGILDQSTIRRALDSKYKNHFSNQERDRRGRF